jgi:hypothetical protein
MAVGEHKNIFKYPAEDECLLRRLGSAVIASWGTLPESVFGKGCSRPQRREHPFASQATPNAASNTITRPMMETAHTMVRTTWMPRA